jgi:inward rectifier potassium channel
MARRIKSFEDLGFGSRLAEAGDRLINKNGSFNVIRKGNAGWNAYQILLAMNPYRFALLTFLIFIGLNILFALMFLYVGIEQLNGVPKGSFINDFLYAFFFSVQTFTTVGYGGINPVGISANFISSLCAMVGLISFALITGLFFARFSRPRSNIAFSEKGLITPYNDITSFQFRIVNTRDHKIINVRARVILSWLEEDAKGKVKRRFMPLELERDEVVLFPLNWTIVHPVNKRSPIYGKTLDNLKKMHAEFLVMINGFDESYNQQIYANSSYICDEIMEGVRFKPMYTSSNTSATRLFLDDLDEVMELRQQPTRSSES